MSGHKLPQSINNTRYKKINQELKKCLNFIIESIDENSNKKRLANLSGLHYQTTALSEPYKPV